MTLRKKDQQRIKDKNRLEESKVRKIVSPKIEESDIIRKDNKTIILKPKNK